MNREIKFRAWDGKYMMSNHEINGDWLLSNKFEHIKPMQYIGLKDKNDKEIYEGDIIQSLSSIGIHIKHEIIYDKATASFRAKYFGMTGDSSISQSWINEFKKEVIGNIYENNYTTKTP